MRPAEPTQRCKGSLVALDIKAIGKYEPLAVHTSAMAIKSISL